MRKLHDTVDAELKDAGGEVGVEAGDRGAIVLFFYNGELTYTRQLPTRALAMAEASAKRAELEREGWMFHW
jgi:hypothetical protein